MQQAHISPPATLANDQPEICACVCTHNGRATLPDCLASLAGQDLEWARFSILVVDDGSTDDSADIFRAWRDEHPELVARLVCQPAAGLSAARNTGLQLSDAPVVAFLDDDATAGPGWLRGLLAGFSEFPNAAAVGGPVEVRWIGDKPRWWRDPLDEVFNRFEPAQEPTTLTFPTLPYGCNFAVRRNVAVGLGRFRTDLGRQKGTLLGGEETELFLRMLGTDYQVAYWPGARVQHLALPQRATRKYILRRAWMHGRSLARLSLAYPAIGRAMPSLPRSCWQMFKLAPRYHFGVAHWKYWLFRLGYHWERRKMGCPICQRARYAATSLRRAAGHG